MANGNMGMGSRKPKVTKPMTKPPSGYNGTRLLDYDMNKFYVEGSVLHSYNFYVDFGELYLPTYGLAGGTGGFDTSNIPDAVWNFPRSHQVVDIDIPSYKFQRESVAWGATQFSYPVLSKEQPIDFKMTLQDNVYGNVGRFVHLLQKSVIPGSGLHNTINNMKIGNIYAYLGDEMKNSVCCWIFRNVFYLGHENLSLAYDSNDPVKYTITFGCDIMTYVSDNKFYGDGERPTDIGENALYRKAKYLATTPTTSLGSNVIVPPVNVFG